MLDFDVYKFLSQYYTQPNWSGGVYAAASFPGSRPGNTIATTWATMMHLGEKGLNEDFLLQYFRGCSSFLMHSWIHTNFYSQTISKHSIHEAYSNFFIFRIPGYVERTKLIVKTANDIGQRYPNIPF